MASVFTLSLGTVHECNTSAAVTIIRIGEFMGSTIRLCQAEGMCLFDGLLDVLYMSQNRVL